MMYPEDSETDSGEEISEPSARRLAVRDLERRRDSEQLDSMERELDLERRNFQLRYEQLAGEKGDLKTEVIRLREKVELLSLEKNMLEQQVVETVGRKVRQEEE